MAALQGSADDVNLTPQRPSANGNFGTPSGGAFATPSSAASQHSLEDEETLLLDPQVPILNSSLCQSWLYVIFFGCASASHIPLPVRDNRCLPWLTSRTCSVLHCIVTVPNSLEGTVCGRWLTVAVRMQAAFVLPRKLLTDAARYFVQAPRAFHSAAPGVSLLDRIEMCCRSDVQLPRQLRDRSEFSFLKASQAA